MRRRNLLATPALLLISRPTPVAAQTGAAVVATFSILADMARVIGGDAITVATLVPPDGDAHTWEPSPADLRRVHDADVLIENGLGLEGWMTRLPQAAGFSGLRITAANHVTARTMSEHGHTVTDPHAWQDAANGVLYARSIAEGLAHAIPAAARDISARAASYIAEIDATDRWIHATLASIPPEKRRILTSHDAFGYYGARYNITLRAVQGINTENEPSARDLATLIAQIRRENIRAVFVENMTNPRLAATVARESGATLGQTVYSDALSQNGGPADTYLAMLHHNTTLFAAAMAAN